ncbi:MAG: glycosyltransferase family 4 protein [Woeseiaceae bacterium]
MHVVQISFFVDPERRSPETLLDEWRSLAEIADSVASTGAQVTVIQASMVPRQVQRSGVTFHFIAPERAGARLTSSAAFQSLLRDLAPDVIHVHGLAFPREVCELRDLVPNVPTLLQDHADRVPYFWRRSGWRRGAAAAAGVSFCSRAQAGPFQRAGLLAPEMPIFEIPEATSLFTPGDKKEARSATGMHGSPAVLWVAHLDANKDPLTVLNAVSVAARSLPELQLWCCYISAPLLSAVQSRIKRDARLRDRVHLLGCVPHEQIEELMRAADCFVLASHREGGNFSLIEALATGLTPIVTDIPSSRALTGDGTVGTLWPCGNWRALARELQTTAVEQRADTRSHVRAYYEAQLSSTAIGQKLISAYNQLIETRRPASTALAVS